MATTITTGRARPYVGLGTFNYTNTAGAGFFNLYLSTTPTPVPGYSSGGAGVGTYTWTPGTASGLTITVTLNSTQVYQSSFVGVHEKGFEIRLPLQFVGSDSLSIALTSSAAGDTTLNGLKTQIAIDQFLLAANV